MPMKKTALDYLVGTQWAIQDDALQQVITVASREGDISALLTKGVRAMGGTRTVSVRGSTAIVPVVGAIFRYANLFTDISGGTSLDVLAKDFQTAADDDSIDRIVLNIDSPGGMSAGISEAAAMIHACNKPVVAYIGGLGASAAYWLASAADRIVIAPTGEAGSIGVIATIQRDDDEGTVQVISSNAPHKRPDLETKEGLAKVQSLVDGIESIFIEDIASYRGVDTAHVTQNFGQGWILLGKDAVSAGLADEVGSLEAVLGESADLIGARSRHSVSTSTEEISMSGDQPTTTTASDDEPVVDIEALQSVAREDGYQAGFKASTTRIQSILTNEAADGREAMARNLAFEQSLDAESAISLLATAPKVAPVATSQLDAEMDASGTPNLSDIAEASNDSSIPDDNDHDATAKFILGGTA